MTTPNQNPANKLILSDEALRRRLQELAVSDFAAFLELVAADGLQVIICAEHEKELSLGQIRQRLIAHGITMSRPSIGDRCKRCPPPIR
jgi:ABC-type cobalamin transport system ATPase subunit